LSQSHAVIESRLLVTIFLPSVMNRKRGLLLPALYQFPRTIRGAIIHHNPLKVLTGLLAQ
jgi:hypothetical protein